jgi:hypothetical protein
MRLAHLRPFSKKRFPTARVNAGIHRVCYVIAARRQDTCGGWSGPLVGRWMACNTMRMFVLMRENFRWEWCPK